MAPCPEGGRQEEELRQVMDVISSHPLCRMPILGPHQLHSTLILLTVDLLPSSIHVKAAGLEGEPSMWDTTASNSNINDVVVGLKLMYWYQDWVWD